MEKLKQSEEIISLGKKIADEFSNSNRGDITVRWMSHYLAELIHKTEHTEEGNAKNKLESECCEIILKIWSLRENLHDSLSPLEGVNETLSILNALKNKKLPYWMSIDINIEKGEWADFASKISELNNEIIKISLLFSLANANFPKTKIWNEKHSAMLTKEENDVIESLDAFAKEKTPFIDMDRTERTAYVFDKLKSLIDDQKIAFELLEKEVKKEKLSKPT